MPYSITRTELVWPGKYDENGKRRDVDRVSLPFQIIERVNESRATREATKTKGMALFDYWKGDDAATFEDGWRNKLIWGENKLVMSSLLDQFAGKVDLIYIDPPFATGNDFSFSVQVGESEQVNVKEQSIIEKMAYRDTWGAGQDSYLTMLSDRLLLMRELLAEDGTIFLHLDPSMAARGRLLLDEILGPTSFINEIIWCYRGGGVPRNAFSRKHDVILWHGRGERHYFEPQYVPYSEASQALIRGRGGTAIDDRPRDLDRGAHMPDWWTDINSLQTWSPERTGYDTQKPEALVERAIAAASAPGALVADFFCGSGTTLVAAEKLGRRWIGVDLGRFAIHTTRKRLLGIEGAKPFEVLNLGRYERQYWQAATFGEERDGKQGTSLNEYVAFILKLYNATPAVGMQHLHGTKNGAFVHVGAIDSPVTIDEIVECIDECAALKAKELHVLGWEWEMGLHDPIEDQARALGVQLVLRQIPREVMEERVVASRDVEFFELAYLDVVVKPTEGKYEFVVQLNDFAVPNPELVPRDVREKIRKWSDFVDYWAVDWNFSGDTFYQEWVTYRTRQVRSLALESDPHAYDGPGQYEIMVKVVDIFGNDTSKICTITVS